MKTDLMNTDYITKKQDLMNTIISDFKIAGEKMVCRDGEFIGASLKNGKHIEFTIIEYNASDNNVYLINNKNECYNLIEWVEDIRDIEHIRDCVKEHCEVCIICKNIINVGKCIKFNTPVMLECCKELGICGIDKIECIDNRLYLFCGHNIYYAIDWLDSMSDWRTLNLAIADYKNIEISNVNSDILYAVSMEVYDEFIDDYMADVIVSKFYTNIDCAIAEKERISTLPEHEKRCLFPCDYTRGIGSCGYLDIVMYELEK